MSTTPFTHEQQHQQQQYYQQQQQMQAQMQMQAGAASSGSGGPSPATRLARSAVPGTTRGSIHSGSTLVRRDPPSFAGSGTNYVDYRR